MPPAFGFALMLVRFKASQPPSLSLYCLRLCTQQHERACRRC